MKSLNFFPILATLAVSAVSVNAADEALIKQGEYLAKLGDCVACHTSEDGRENAGGLPFATPFGVVYSTNITPDVETGIGEYDYDDFYDALHNGKGNAGNLYPAMPYTSYKLLTDEDTQALFAYFMSLKPVSNENKDNAVMFPFNIRMGLKGWNLIAHDNDQFQKDETKSDQWNRGSYLVNSLGHCGECHTPRTTVMAMDEERHLQGAIIEGYEAPDITPAELNRQNWTHEDLANILSKGYSRKGTIFGGMYPVVYHSFSYLTQEDMKAVTSYLLDNGEAIEPKALTFNGHNKELAGYDTYKGYCAGCHGQEGEGRPNVAPAIQGNATLDRTSAYNGLAVLLRGIESQYFDTTTGFYAMPDYSDDFTDQELMDLINYLRVTWTSQPGDVTAETVKEVREESRVPALH